jgi:hypothetical protein
MAERYIKSRLPAFSCIKSEKEAEESVDTLRQSAQFHDAE